MYHIVSLVSLSFPHFSYFFLVESVCWLW